MKVLRRWLDTAEENITDREEFSSRNNPNRNTERKASFKNDTVLVSYEKISGFMKKSLVL